MRPYAKSERTGIVVLLVVVLSVTCLGLIFSRCSSQAPMAETPTVVYRTVTDTVYRTRKSAKGKKQTDADKKSGKKHSRKGKSAKKKEGVKRGNPGARRNPLDDEIPVRE